MKLPSWLPALPWYGWAGLAGLFVVGTGIGKAAAAPGGPAGKALPSGPPQPPGAPPVISQAKGSSGPWVAFLRSLLGMPAGTTFDAATHEAVVAHQKLKALTPDGIVGKMTWGSLGISGAAAPAGPSGGSGSPGTKPDFLGATGSWDLPDSQAERQKIIVAEVAAGNHSLAQPDGWATIDLSRGGHTGSIMVSRRPLALIAGADRLIVSTDFNTAMKVANNLGGMVMLTSRLADAIWEQAALKLKPQARNWVLDGSMGKTSRMIQLSGELDNLVGGETGLVANEGKDWVLTKRNWAPPQGTGVEKPEGAKGSLHNGANFGFYPGGSKSPGGLSVIQSVGLAHDRNHSDYCLAAGTLVDTPLGHRPIEQLEPGDLVFSYNHERARPDCSRVASRMSTGVQPTLLVELDNGERVRCTPNHRWLLVDGSECLASDLEVGSRLLPLRRSHAGAGYETLYSRSSHRYSYTHRAIACAGAGVPYKTRGLVTHHKDENKRNNHPDNLELITGSGHAEEHDHADRCRAQWANPEMRARMAAGISRGTIGRTSWCKGMRSGTTQPCQQCGAVFYARPSLIKRKFCSITCSATAASKRMRGPATVCAGCGSDFYRSPGAQAKYCSSRCFGSAIREGVARRCSGCNAEYYRPPSQSGKYCSAICYQAVRRVNADLNHRVVGVERDGLCVPTYDIEVERDHNFALAAGVFVHNSQQLKFAHPDSLIVDGAKRNYEEVLADPELSILLSDEGPLPGSRHPDFA